MKKLILLGILFLITIVHAQELTVMTEEYPPYNYNNNEVVSGLSTEIIQEILFRAKIDYDLKLLPWTRGYRDVLEKENTILYSMTFTKEREPLFKWVGPLIKTRISVIAKKSSNIKINSFSDLKKYKIGVIKNDVGEQLLKQNGVSDKLFQKVSRPQLNVKKLNIDRIELIAYDENVNKWITKRLGFDTKNYETVKILKEAELYIAFNKKTSNAIIKKCQNILDKMKKDGTYKKIVAKYL